MPKNEYAVSKRVIVTPDKHFPLHDKKAISVVCKAIELVKPDAYIDLGDTGEWSLFSRHHWKNKEKPPLEVLIPMLDKEVKSVNKGMDIIDKALDNADCNERYFIQGNHEVWLDKFVTRYPYLTEYMTQNALKLKERGYKYYRFGKHLKIGKLYFYHGHQYGGQYHTDNHIRKLGCNVMYGHWHDLQQMSATHMDGPKSAWSIGCLKDMSDEANGWLGNRKINWAHAFAIVDFFKGGLFTVHIIQIIKGRTSLWGELIEGK